MAAGHENLVSFREVFQNQSSSLRWKEITVSTGGLPGSAKDNKYPVTAGGYCYTDSARTGTPCRNRSIYWRADQETLELVEICLDYDLSSNCVRFRFQDAPILSGVSVHESHGNVFILVPTVCSVHRLAFPHPNRIQHYDYSFTQDNRQSMASIFSDTSVMRIHDSTNSHNIQQGAPSPYLLHTAATWMTSQAEALFAMATNTGAILLVKLPPPEIQSIVSQTELRQSSVMQRLWSGLVPGIIKGAEQAVDLCLSMTIQPMYQDTYIFTVCKDHKIRIWSTKRQECVMVGDLTEYIADRINPQKAKFGSTGHRLCKSTDSTSQTVHLGVYLNFSDRSQFLVLQPVMADGSFQLRHVSTVYTSQDSLVDFSLTSDYLWALWSNSDGEAIVRCAPIINEKPGEQIWLPVTMETMEGKEIEQNEYIDPRESYMEAIFYPGRFSTQAILKALNIYKRSVDSTHLANTHIPINALKNEVSSVVEHEIQVQAEDTEMYDEEYIQLQLTQWSKFYSCCVQYQERSLQSLGLYTDPNTGLVAIVKKGTMSFMRPTQPAEHLFLTPAEECYAEDLRTVPLIGDDDQLCRDVVILCDSLKRIQMYLSEAVCVSFEKDLLYTQDPLEVVNNIVSDIMAADTEYGEDMETLQGELEQHIHSIQDVFTSCETLLYLLDLTDHENDGQAAQPMEQADDLSEVRKLCVGHLFRSVHGVQVVAATIHQIATYRLAIARNMLVFLNMATQLGDQVGLDLHSCEKIRGVLMGRFCALTQAFVVLKWASETQVTAVQNGAIESIQRQMACLEHPDTPGVAAVLQKFGEQNVTILELFLYSSGGRKTRESLSQQTVFDEDPCMVWNQGLLPVAMSAAQLIWPLSSGNVLTQFLLTHCQHVALQNLIRLTKDWCDTSRSVNKFMLALSYLNCNEAYKSLECFLDASYGVTQEDEFFKNLLPGATHNNRYSEVLYYLKVLRLFELFEYPELVLELARIAIDIAEDDDPNVPTLWSKVFKQQLEMGHYEEAYTAMISNPDNSRRKDCLRQFLVTLCERSKLDTLVSLPYKDGHIDLEDEVINILESRARAIDLTKHSYYDLLYSFHINRANYKKASSVMYEFGMRLGQEASGLKALQKQAKCYLAALNALRLVKPEYAWIIKPLSSNDKVNEVYTLPKHAFNGEEINVPVKKQVELIELEQMEKEYMLVHARLQLYSKQPDNVVITGPTGSGEETVGQLVNAGLFDSAINICKLYNMSLTPVFETLASKCMQLSENSNPHILEDNEYTSKAWHWLNTNHLGQVNTKEVTATEQSWRLLQRYLEKHEKVNSVYHRAVTIRLLSHGFSLPNWFIESYQKINGSELLRLYLDYDLLEEAAYMAMQYIDAILGKGKEYFGLKTFLNSRSPAVWLPYTCIDQLLLALRSVQTDPQYTKLYQQLNYKLSDYFDTLEKVSHDVIQGRRNLAYSGAGMMEI